PTSERLGARGSDAMGQRGTGAPSRPGQADDGDEHTEQAGQLGHAERPQPEAVEADRLDGEPSDRVEADIGEEQRARLIAQTRPQPDDQEAEDEQVPYRLVEERRVEEVELRVAGR